MRDFAKKYLDVLEGPLAGINLTRILDFEDFYNKQIYDSVRPAEISEIFSNSIKEADAILDIGFGGGFPLVPLASIFKDKTFIGIDSRNKKAQAVKLICEELNISNAFPLHGRIENFDIDIKATLIFKAVGKIPDCLALLNVTKKSRVFFYKGPGLYEQENITKFPSHFKKIEECSFELPDGSHRILIGYEISPVPRGTKSSKSSKNNKKNLVKISSLKTELTSDL